MSQPFTIGQGIDIGGGITFGAVPIVSTNLQLYLDAANAASYSGSGTTWYDLSGNGNTVAMQNSGDISYTNSGGGYFSTGATGYFEKTSPTNIPFGSNPYTISTWVQIPTGWPGTDNLTMVNIGSTPTYRNFNSFGASSTGYLYNAWFREPSDPADLVTTSWTPSSPSTNWMNVVVEWDTTTRSIWYNGVQQISQTVGTGYLGNNTDVLIGVDYPGFGNYLRGNIGQVLIYNRALNSNEINQNFIAVKARYGL